MITIGKRTYRNLEEQVAKNQADIEAIVRGNAVLAEFGIKVVGLADDTTELPDPLEYEGDFGDAFLVGSSAPYDYYIFTRPLVGGSDEPFWFNLGQFPLPGPQGEQGVQGPQGEPGVTPRLIFSIYPNVPELPQGPDDTLIESYAPSVPMLKVYRAVAVAGTPNYAWVESNSITAPTGPQGPQGVTGPQGPQGIQGLKGDKGDQGGLIRVFGIVATSDLLPLPSVLNALDAAYLVGSDSYDLWIQIGESPATAIWSNVGAFNVGTIVSVNNARVPTWDADTKVDKLVGTGDTTYVYTFSGSTQGYQAYAVPKTANTIALRDGNGVVKTGTPSSDDDAVPLAFLAVRIPDGIMTSVGDLLVRTSQGVTRLPVDGNGKVLTSDAGDPLAPVKWKDKANLAEFAENLTPFSETSGTTQDAPFISQGTATSNNAAIVDTGSSCKFIAKQGNSVVVNQLVGPNTNSVTYESGRRYIKLSGTTYTGILGTGESEAVDASTDKVIDLTQWFVGNSNIPQDLIDNPDHFPYYYNGSLAPNSGTIVNSDGRFLVCTHRQLWDEETEIGGIDTTTGQNTEASNIIRSKNYTLVIPNQSIYIKSSQNGVLYWYDINKNYLGYGSFASAGYYVVPNNAYYLRFRLAGDYGTTYKYDITVSKYYTPQEGGEGYDKYYPYVAPKVYDTGSESLGAFDKKVPSGLITRATDYIDLGEFTPSIDTDSAGNQFVFNINIGGRKFICVKYPESQLASNQGWGDLQNKTISCHPNPTVNTVFRIRDDSYATVDAFKAGNVGIRVYFIDPAPTTEQGTSYPEYAEIDDYGIMYWLDGNNDLVSIPQGLDVFYPVDYKASLDTLIGHTNGDIASIMLQSDNVVPSPPAADGTYTLKCTVSDGSITYAWISDSTE